MKKRHQFSDGSVIDWESKEGLRYEEGDFVALIWLDFSPGLFSRTRVLKLSSLDQWHQKPENHPREITESKREEIIEKVRFFTGKKVLLELDHT